MKLKSNDPCWCGSGAKHKRCHGDRRAVGARPVPIGNVTPPRSVPDHIVRPDYVTTGRISTSRKPQIQDAESLTRLRHACAVAAKVLIRTGEHVAVGRTTEQLDEIAHDTYIELGAYPSTLHYRGYTKSICTSVNGVICHGIPDDRPLEDGDIVNIDVTAFVDGMHGDNSATFHVGTPRPAMIGLIETTREATLRGIDAIRPFEPLQNVAEAIETFAASRGYGVVAEYGGHGIGATFHADPHVNHCVVRGDDSFVLPGMTFTVEPMLLTGRPEFHQAADGWTEHVDDNRPSAQFEHTVLVTDDGAEILTVTDDGRTAVGTLADLARSGSA
ncbi:type I methionyl aminopeptidase [Ilumatobacter nonamiensis]|uniref:type I methionyl aminopeptidase n=1 Tax=Ilumatobacter nonamiensis TaxID=467093 RepID=UPI00034B1C77|nr:type I methionyl aminopeptidase [Ilumatobacter nonamiensis]